jgi:hypothetical protein
MRRRKHCGFIPVLVIAVSFFLLSSVFAYAENNLKELSFISSLAAISK